MRQQAVRVSTKWQWASNDKIREPDTDSYADSEEVVKLASASFRNSKLELDIEESREHCMLYLPKRRNEEEAGLTLMTTITNGESRKNDRAMMVR